MHSAFAFLQQFPHFHTTEERTKLYTTKIQLIPAERPVTRGAWSLAQSSISGTMLCAWKSQLTSNNKHDARGQSHIGFCRILHGANSDALHSKNAHKEAKDAQDDTHDHKGPHSLKHCCKTNQPEPWWTSEVRLIGGWEAFKDYFKIKIKMLKEKNNINILWLAKSKHHSIENRSFFFTKKEKA